jgi:hypothetical protein
LTKTTICGNVEERRKTTEGGSGETEKPRAGALGRKYTDGVRTPQGGLSPPPILGTLYQNRETKAT